jgi:hypothetical protein
MRPRLDFWILVTLSAGACAECWNLFGNCNLVGVISIDYQLSSNEELLLNNQNLILWVRILPIGWFGFKRS